MLRWSLVCFVAALIAAFLGFGGITLAVSGLARVLFFLFVAALIVTLVLDFVTWRLRRVH